MMDHYTTGLRALAWDICFGLDGRELRGREADRMKEPSTHDTLYGSESGIGTSASHDSSNRLCNCR